MLNHMKSLSDIQGQKQRHRNSEKTEDWFYVHNLGKNYWFVEVFVEQLNGHHETFEAQFIKLIISGEMPIGLLILESPGLLILEQ